MKKAINKHIIIRYRAMWIDMKNAIYLNMLSLMKSLFYTNTLPRDLVKLLVAKIQVFL